MEFCLVALGGIIATTAMLAVLGLIGKTQWPSVNLIKTMGSLVTQSQDRHTGVGIVIVYSFGVVLALGFALLLGLSHIRFLSEALILSGFAGCVSGVVAGMILVGFIGSRHPIKQFKMGGMGQFASVVAGHIVYGLSIGLVLGLKFKPSSEANQYLVIPLQETLGASVLEVLLFGTPFFFLTVIFIISGFRLARPAHKHA
jgi:uncharacterized membrane protein YagU involved in acid resistance